MSGLSAETLEGSLKIGLFLEDVAQERFVRSLIRKAAASAMEGDVDFETRNAVGGAPRMQEELRKYARDYLQAGVSGYDLVVVCQDTDCQGVPAIKGALIPIVTAAYAGPLVIAAPDPCIEAWYLADQAAMRTVAQAASTPPLPSGCDCGALKTRIRNLFREGGVSALLQGGAEYADEVVGEMNIERARRGSASLDIFVSDLLSAIRSA